MRLAEYWLLQQRDLQPGYFPHHCPLSPLMMRRSYKPLYSSVKSKPKLSMCTDNEPIHRSGTATIFDQARHLGDAYIVMLLRSARRSRHRSKLRSVDSAKKFVQPLSDAAIPKCVGVHCTLKFASGQICHFPVPVPPTLPPSAR